MNPLRELSKNLTTGETRRKTRKPRGPLLLTHKTMGKRVLGGVVGRDRRKLEQKNKKNTADLQTGPRAPMKRSHCGQKKKNPRPLENQTDGHSRGGIPVWKRSPT